MTELFGPVLGVMSYKNLNEAIDLVHQTGYGLTSGLESLDDREQKLWLSRLNAGNLYINRPTTGAIVLRQPFGGMGRSAFGPGIKAGGPNYVVQLMDFPPLIEFVENDETEIEQVSKKDEPALNRLAELWNKLHSESQTAKKIREVLSDDEWAQLLALIVDFDRFAVEEIHQSHDSMRLVGQDNLRRYQPMTHVRIRLSTEDTWLDILARAIAVVAAGGRAAISHAPGVQVAAVEALESITHEWAGDLEFVQETDEQLIEAILAGQVDRVRYGTGDTVPLKVREAADEQFVYVADRPISHLGRLELLWYVREQSVCVDYHRYGNLGFRVLEERGPVL